MILAGLVFLTPSAVAVAFAVLIPVAAFVLAERRVSVVRRTLMLQAPRGGVDVAALASLVAVVLLLALAAAQPALSSTESQRVRTDAQVLFVVDVSQSMAAAGRRDGATRLDRARAAAIRLRSLVPGLSSGVATLTDRVLPNLLPVPDAAAFDATVNQTLAINQPPPRELNVRATNFGALSSIPASGYFDDSATHRAVVLLTDGESAFFEPTAVARALGVTPRTNFVAVQFWRRNESVYKASGKPDPNYRSDPASKATLASLAAATHGQAFSEDDLAAAAAALRAHLGSGPTRAMGTTRTTHPLGPYIALLALIPLGLVFTRNLRFKR
ncbi:MAG TPA: hypothetical protein VF232_07000 [Gaiellaceae bacterium]